MNSFSDVLSLSGSLGTWIIIVAVAAAVTFALDHRSD
jgi:hypothetical protein